MIYVYDLVWEAHTCETLWVVTGEGLTPWQMRLHQSGIYLRMQSPIGHVHLLLVHLCDP